MNPPRSLGASTPPGRPLSPPAHSYLTVPYRLITDLHDNPLALGLYSLVARMFLVEQRPLPLSTIDVQRYDPSLSRGAIIRAFARLVRGGWLLESAQRGLKTCYTPCWGLVAGQPRRWVMDAPALGRPRHVHALRLERRLLDTYMGRLTTHATRGALVERYVSHPLLGLSDVGAYLIALQGQPATTSQLARYGLVVHGQAQPLPSDAAILAQASQRCLEDAGELTITEKGFRKLGWPQPQHVADRQQPLFFVPPALIGTMIASMIGQTARADRAVCEAPSGQTSREARAMIIPGNQIKSEHATPQPPTQPNGGGKQNRNTEHRQKNEGKRPETPAAQLLRSINVRPVVVAELANMPADLVQAAIADGKGRQEVLDLAGWVVSMLRDARDHGWQIARTPGLAEEELRERIERAKASGLFRYDGEDGAGNGVCERVEPPARTGARQEPDRTSSASRQDFSSLPTWAGAQSEGRWSSEPGSPPLARAAGASGQPGAAGVASAAAPISAASPASSLQPITLLRDALKARTRPELHRLIGELELQQSDQGLVIWCRDRAALAAAQELLPLVRPLLAGLGCPNVPRIAALLRPERR